MYEKLEKIIEKDTALNAAMALLEYDNETQAPKGALDNTSKIMGTLSALSYETVINDEVKNLLNDLVKEDLTEIQAKTVKKMKKDFDKMEKIPADEYQAFSELQSKAQGSWQKAKAKSDYSIFEGDLTKLLMYQKKFAGYCKKDGQSDYDYWLNENDEGFGEEKCEEFFSLLKEKLLPLIKKIKDKNMNIKDDFLYKSYDINKQREFCDFLAKYIGFDTNCGITGEVEHPFTTSLHNKDVRFTNHFHENMFMSACLSAIHEGGHALFEQGVSDDLAMTPLGAIDSMAIHESQSRLYENNIARSKEFWIPIYPELVSTFPKQLKKVSIDEFVRAINKSTPSLIRTEADELTYSFHIMIRYEMEKLMIEGKVDMDDLPEIWNKKYEEYLGVIPENDSEGILQDVHWTGGIGYFPSYSVGSAISAQIMNQMRKDLDVDDILKSGELMPIRNYLKENVHRFGSSKTPNEILKNFTGEEFNPKYYVDYLTKKYTELYDL